MSIRWVVVRRTLLMIRIALLGIRWGVLGVKVWVLCGWDGIRGY